MKVDIVKMFTNGNVMVFDEEGEQIPELQGFLFNVISKLREECDEETNFSFNEWKGREMECDFGWWFGNNNKERDLERAIENRTEDPDELLDPEDIDVDASDIKVGWRKLARKSLKEKIEEPEKANYEKGFEDGYRKKRKEILKLIEKMKVTVDSQHDAGYNLALKTLKQKLKGQKMTDEIEVVDSDEFDWDKVDSVMFNKEVFLDILERSDYYPDDLVEDVDGILDDDVIVKLSFGEEKSIEISNCFAHLED